MPATFARMSTFPTFCAATAQSDSPATSSSTNCPPMRSATARPLASSRSAIQRVAPAWTKISAMAAPIPEAPPVTRAVLFSRLNTINPFGIGPEELNPILLFREWDVCLGDLDPALVTCRQGQHRPIASEHQPFRAETRKCLPQIGREFCRLPVVPVGFRGQSGNFSHDIGKGRECGQIRCPRLKTLVAHIRFAKVVEDESDFRHTPPEFGCNRQLLVAKAQIESEAELSQERDTRYKFGLQTEFRLRFGLQVSPHTFNEQTARQRFQLGSNGFTAFQRCVGNDSF